MGKQPITWYREPWLWLVILIPASAVVMGILAISLSFVSYDGLVVDDYYKRGLEINRDLARDRAAANYALGARVVLDRSRGSATAWLSWGNGFRPSADIATRLLPCNPNRL